MKKMLIAVAAVLLLLSSAVASEIQTDPADPSYHNERYGFTVKWAPGAYRVYEADNGDGITVSDGHGLEMRVWGSLDQDVFGLTEKDFYQRARDSRAEYSVVNTSQRWYVVSGRRGNNIYYVKSFYTDDAVMTMRIEYPAALKSMYDSFVKEAVKGFLPGRKF